MPKSRKQELQNTTPPEEMEPGLTAQAIGMEQPDAAPMRTADLSNMSEMQVPGVEEAPSVSPQDTARMEQDGLDPQALSLMAQGRKMPDEILAHKAILDMQQAPTGREGAIGKEQVQEASQILQKYKQGKASLEERIIDNEQWFKMRHWEQIRRKNKGYNPNDPEPASAWLFNSIANKHADAMDNFPEPNILPREETDKPDADMLGKILPVVLEHNDFEQTYSDAWWYKLKTGTGVYGVFWNPKLENGLGDIDVKELDLLNIFWEPGITDIQKSKNLFTVELVDNDILQQQYEFLSGKLSASSVDVAKYIMDESIDTSDKSAVVDWYYKVQRDGRTVLHYCKYVNDEVLYASENDPAYAERGFYDHAQYPVIFDTMFVEAGMPTGFGYIDVMKDAQMYIDKLDQITMRNVFLMSKPRFFIRDNGTVNEEEFSDWSKDFVHCSSGLGEDSIRQIVVSPLTDLCVTIKSMKVDELKETSGNRDFSQGSTTSGVTAASAIAALQEAGSKLSRDMIKSGYRAFKQINYLCIELIRQFYDEPRSFRITGPQGEKQYVHYDNTRIRPQHQGTAFGVDLGYRRPVFDIEVTAQKASPFSKIAQNELAKELYGGGFFNPQMVDQAMIALDMMSFDGKDMVVQKISQNRTLYQQLMQMQEQMQKMAILIDNAYGSTVFDNLNGAVQQEQKEKADQPKKNRESKTVVETNPLGKAVRTSKNNTASTAKEKAQDVGSPKS